MTRTDGIASADSISLAMTWVGCMVTIVGLLNSCMIVLSVNHSSYFNDSAI